MNNPHKRADSILRQLEQEGLIPRELARHAVWRDLRALGFHGAQRAKLILERYCDREIDPAGWIRALRGANG